MYNKPKPCLHCGKEPLPEGYETRLIKCGNYLYKIEAVKFKDVVYKEGHAGALWIEEDTPICRECYGIAAECGCKEVMERMDLSILKEVARAAIKLNDNWKNNNAELMGAEVDLRKALERENNV